MRFASTAVEDTMLQLVLALALASGSAAAGETLATVRITQPVVANGTPLQPGSYELRLTDEFVPPRPGQSADAERWVEVLQNGAVVAREAAVVKRDEATAHVGTSSASGANRVRVDLLKGGEFLRVSVRHGAERYLIHFTVAR